jgi:hypothetical protein
MSKTSAALLLIYPHQTTHPMTAGIRYIATRLITKLALLSETLDFVEREREQEKGARDEGQGARFRWLSEEL